jgi:uncharacterized repeat protein (TIGR01451 family)
MPERVPRKPLAGGHLDPGLLDRGRAATINCGQGRQSYTGGPFAITSPAQAGVTLTCTIVNTRRPVPPQPPPNLAVTKQALKRVVRGQEAVGFFMAVANRGRGPARNVTVCDRLPDGLVFVRAPGARFVMGDACWRVTRLASGARRNYFVLARAMNTARRKVIVNVVVVGAANTNCAPAAARSLARATADCTARWPLVVRSVRVRRVGGVTG